MIVRLGHLLLRNPFFIIGSNKKGIGQYTKILVISFLIYLNATEQFHGQDIYIINSEFEFEFQIICCDIWKYIRQSMIKW